MPRQYSQGGRRRAGVKACAFAPAGVVAAIFTAGALGAGGCYYTPQTSTKKRAPKPVLSEKCDLSGKHGSMDHERKLAPPPLHKALRDCNQGCHDDPPNTKRRLLSAKKLKEFEVAGIHPEKIHHGPKRRWCFDCHNPKDRTKLRLASGEMVPFTQSQLLCGQCHGPKLRDWKAGVHGKRIGSWRGKKCYFLCVNCHNPHSPRFKALKPLPAPIPPARIR